MQAVEYNTLDDLDLEGGATSEAGGGEETRKLEEMLMAKNKQLENRLTEARRACDAAEGEAKGLQEQLAELQRKSLEQGSLIAKLEESLYQKDSGCISLRVSVCVALPGGFQPRHVWGRGTGHRTRNTPSPALDLSGIQTVPSSNSHAYARAPVHTHTHTHTHTHRRKGRTRLFSGASGGAAGN